LLLTVAAPSAVRYVEDRTATTLPPVPRIEAFDVLVDRTPVAVTTTAAGHSIPAVVWADELRGDVTLWRRMHVADWNTVPASLRQTALDAMLARYAGLLSAPRLWQRLTADTWDSVPQPIRIVAYRRMVEFWAAFYDVGAAHDLPADRIADTLAAIVMSESWFEHRAVNVGYKGQRDYGLAQASESARVRMRRLHASGDVDVFLADEDYFNPWHATRFVAVWMRLLLEETEGDLDFAVRAYHRGIPNAFDARGDDYLETVQLRMHRFIGHNGSSRAWNDLWERARAQAAGVEPCSTLAVSQAPRGSVGSVWTFECARQIAWSAGADRSGPKWAEE
jgi:hypothetical protein